MKPRNEQPGRSAGRGKGLLLSVTATPMTDAERQDLARAVADLVFIALPQTAASTPTAPAAGLEAQEAA